MTEFAQRRDRNGRYSLRAFARDLGTDHATLSQVVRHKRVLSPRLAKKFGLRLNLPERDILEACERHNADAIVKLGRGASFRPNSRWISTRTGLPLDTVNSAIARLVHERRLVMQSTGSWLFP